MNPCVDPPPVGEAQPRLHPVGGSDFSERNLCEAKNDACGDENGSGQSPCLLYPPDTRLLPPSVFYPHTYHDLATAPALHGICVFAFDMLIGPVVWAQWPPGIMPQEQFREISDMVVCGDEFANTMLTLHIPSDPAIYASDAADAPLLDARAAAEALLTSAGLESARPRPVPRAQSVSAASDAASSAESGSSTEKYGADKYTQLVLFPVNVQDTKYYRNSFFFSVALLLPAHAPAQPYSALAREIALFLAAVERDSGLMLGQTKEEQHRVVQQQRALYAARDAASAGEGARERPKSSAASGEESLATMGEQDDDDASGDAPVDGQSDGPGDTANEDAEASTAPEADLSDGSPKAATASLNVINKDAEQHDSEQRASTRRNSSAAKPPTQQPAQSTRAAPASRAAAAPPVARQSSQLRADTRPRDELLAAVFEAVMLQLPLRGHCLLTAASGHSLRLSTLEWTQPFRVRARAWDRELFWKSEKGKIPCDSLPMDTPMCAAAAWDSAEYAQEQRERDMQRYADLARTYPVPAPLPTGALCPRERRRRRALLRECMGLAGTGISAPVAPPVAAFGPEQCLGGAAGAGAQLQAAVAGVDTETGAGAAVPWGWHELEQDAQGRGASLYAAVPGADAGCAVSDVCPCAQCSLRPESVPVRVSGWAQLEHVLGLHQRHLSTVHSRTAVASAEESAASALRGWVSGNDHFCEHGVLVAVFSAVDDATPVWRIARALRLSVSAVIYALQLLHRWGVLSLGRDVQLQSRYRLCGYDERAHWCRGDCGLFVCARTLRMALAYATAGGRVGQDADICAGAAAAADDASNTQLTPREAALLRMLTALDSQRGWGAARGDEWAWLWGGGAAEGVKIKSKSRRLQDLWQKYKDELQGVCFIRLFTYLTRTGEVEEDDDELSGVYCEDSSDVSHRADSSHLDGSTDRPSCSKDEGDGSSDWRWWAEQLNG